VSVAQANRRLRIGLVASPFHRNGPNAALFRWLRPLESALRGELQPDMRVVGQTCDALAEGDRDRDDGRTVPDGDRGRR